MKSFRGQLLLIFLFFILVSLLTAFYTSHYYNERQYLAQLGEKLNLLEIKLLQSLNEQENFFNFELVNEAYYSNQESSYLTKYNLKIQELDKLIAELFESPYVEENSKKTLKRIRYLLSDYKISFQAITHAIHQRGFRDFGLIGKMRKSAHRLEDESLLSAAEILMLRRHEKDYIIRQDDIYLKEHAMLINKCIKSLVSKEYLSDEQKLLTRKLLIEYDHHFKEMAKLERTIGLKTNKGLKRSLNENIASIINELTLFKATIKIDQSNQMEKLNYSLAAFWLIYLLLALWLSITISKKFTFRLSQLSRHINYFVNTNFTARLNPDIRISEDEIGTLWSNFLKMENEIIDYIELFKEKVDEKTLELSKRNHQIEKQKRELELQKAETELKNKDLTDGMKYGWRIQRALLPTSSRFEKQLENAFVLFMPKDIVSGDVYFTHKIKRKDGDESIFSTIDCTGHGVPGAFMSILALNSINNAVMTVKHREPHYILQEANNFIYSSMKYYLNDLKKINNKDGMDLLVCNLKREKLELSFAGANRPLYLVRAQDKDQGIGLDESEFSIVDHNTCRLYEIFPVKKTVGTIKAEHSGLFIKKDLQIQKGDMLYLTSDGYADQFGGPNDKKFMTKRLKQFVCEIYPLNVEEQRERLKTAFLDWKGNNDQIDDVCILGVRI